MGMKGENDDENYILLNKKKMIDRWTVRRTMHSPSHCASHCAEAATSPSNSFVQSGQTSQVNLTCSSPAWPADSWAGSGYESDLTH